MNVISIEGTERLVMALNISGVNQVWEAMNQWKSSHLAQSKTLQ